MIDNNKKTPQVIESFNPDLSSVLKEKEEEHYLIIIADLKKADIYLFNKGEVEANKKVMDPGVRKRTRINSGELFGRNDKVARHIDHQVHLHL